MEKLARLKELHMERRKSFRVLLAAEFILLLLGIAGLFGKNEAYEYGTDDMTVNSGKYTDGGILIDSASADAAAGEAVDFAGISLPAGTYRVQLKYTTDTDAMNLCYVSDDSMSGGMLRTNGAQLFSGLNSTDYDMMLLKGTSGLVVHIYYDGTGMLSVQGMTIRRTNGFNRIILFCMVCLFTAVNAVCLYREYDRKYQIPVKNKSVAFFLGMIMLAASIHLTVDYMPSGGDLVYHLMRVEGIKDGILAGQFPIRISPEWQQGYGYASPIFYGETVLYIAALFRLIGFTVTTSYRLFMFVVVAATVIIAYECFKKIFRDEYVGVFCSMLYSLSIYRIYKTYLCGSWGECFGIMFLPLTAYGFYRVFTQDINEKSYKRSWIPLTAGFTMLFQSHLLTCEMAGVFTIILCIILWKKVFRKETFIVLAKTVIYSMLLSAWFLIPFADYMLTGDFVIHHVSGRTIQYRGLFPAHLFFTFFINGENVFFDSEGMADSAATGVGIVLVAPLIVFLYLLFSGKAKELTGNEKGVSVTAAAFSVLAMIMSLSFFPWDKVQAVNQITATLVSSIQFPNRFLTIANAGLTIVAGAVAKYALTNKDKSVKIIYFAGMLLLVAIGNIYLINWSMNNRTPLRVYNSEGMGTGYISGAEYLPYGAKAELFMYHDPVCSGELEVRDYERLSLGASAYMVNSGSEPENAAFSLLYYKGYHAYASDTGAELDCFSGENCEVTVEIPAGFEGNVTVKFVSPIYWRAGELVSIVTLIVMVIVCTVGTSRKNLNNAGEVER